MPTNGSDTLTGGVGNDSIDARAGNDSVNGLAGNDTLEGGVGDDTLEGGVGDDSLLGGFGFDSLRGGVGNDTLSGGTENDILSGDEGNDLINGGDGIDTVSYSQIIVFQGISVNLFLGSVAGGSVFGNDTLSSIEAVVGSNMNDTLTSSSAVSATLSGGGGDDTLSGSGLDDSLDGGSGADFIRAENGADSVIGSSGNDRILGGLGADTLRGGQDDDFLEGDLGNDLLDGGNGLNDVVSFEFANGDAGARVSLDLVSGFAVLGSGGETDTLLGLEHVVGSVFNDTILGNAEANRLDGRPGADLIVGREGADTLIGGSENDTLDGETGADSLLGEAGRDVLLGGDNADTLDGGDDNDQLSGGAGNDSMRGGSGDDLLIGDAGDDTLDGGTGAFDTADYSTETGPIRKFFGLGVEALSGFDELIGIERIIGSAFNDTIGGSTGNDILEGGEGVDSMGGGDGADTLRGGGGDDRLFADLGNDLIDGGLGFNTVLYDSFGDGSVSVDLLAGTSTGAGNDTLMSIHGVVGAIGNDTVRGSDLANVLKGGSGNDVIDGRGGADSLIGDGGDDVLNGGDGNDTLSGSDDLTGESIGRDQMFGGAGNDLIRFRGGDRSAAVFNTAQHGVDTIADFNPQARNRISYQAPGISFMTGSVGLDLDADGVFDDARIVTDQGTVVLLNTIADQLLLSRGLSGEVVVGGSGADLILTVVDFGLAHRLLGGAGDDTIVYGADTQGFVDGGAGSDLLVNVFAGTAALQFDTNEQVVVLMDSGIANGAQTGFDRFIGFDNVRLGSGNDVVAGGGDAERLNGADGDDWIDGGGGNDRLDGSSGGDSLLGGGGNDTISGGAGLDFLFGGAGVDTYLAPFERVVADLASGFVNSPAGVALDFVQPDFEIYQFLDRDDIVTGWTHNLTVNLGGGNDWFADFSPGAGNNDVINGDDFGLVGADTIFGLAGNDRLNGDGGNDQLYGGDGADSLIGGFGADYLSGGAGVDRFVFQGTFESTLTAPGIIADFQTGIDRIDLNEIDANTAAIGLQDFTFVAGFTGVAGQVRIRALAGFAVVEGDTNGDSVADIVITVIGSTPTAADLIL